MEQLQSPLSEMFEKSCPLELQRNLVRMVWESYEEVEDYLRVKLPPPQAHDLRPQLRHAIVERNLANMAHRHVGVNASNELNVVRNAYHVIFRTGAIALTSASVSTPKQMVRYAVFRHTYAQRYQRMLPTLEVDDRPLDGEHCYYAVLLHGPESQRPDRLGFVSVAFPDRDCECYIERLDLIARHPDVIDIGAIVDRELIPAEIDISLRADTRKREKDA